MDTFKSFEPLLYSVNESSFENIALSLFRFQAEHNPLYRQWLTYLSISPKDVKTVAEIPFLPIAFFKKHAVKTGNWAPETVFRSSGTTGVSTSSHYVRNLDFYRNHALRNFYFFFGPLKQYHLLALLPSYLERKDSSLVSMIDYFIQQTGSTYSGFYLQDIDKLLMDIEALRGGERPVILWGVSFALLEIAEKYNVDMSHCLIFETGGMKGTRQEIIREELHDRLSKGLHVKSIYSEYGMTELFSQAYTRGEKLFYWPPWMRVVGRDISDPRSLTAAGESCALNVIDLANWHSVAFIETEDIGRIHQNGAFEVLGRLDNSDARGCNLLLN